MQVLEIVREEVMNSSTCPSGLACGPRCDLSAAHGCHQQQAGAVERWQKVLELEHTADGEVTLK